MKMKRIVAFVVSLCMLMSFAPLHSVAVAAETTTETSEELVIEKIEGDEVKVNLAQNTQIGSDLVIEQEEIDENEEVRVIIVMEGESVIEENAAAVLDDETAEKMENLEQIQEEVIERIEETVLEGEKLEISYNYTWLLNGVATRIPYGAIEKIAAVKGVKQVIIQPVYSVCEVETDSSASPYTVADGVMIGRESAWAQGYTGEGMKIAVIDTGLDIDHPNFMPLSEDKLTASSATKETVAAVLSGLNATSRVGELDIDDVYYNTKVAFGYNYCDDNLNITHDYDQQGSHGTHVAGIAAANKIEESEVVGVAPDAQLYIMKVFGAAGGAYSEDILAALEDALLLGADVVNMSLGSTAGFTSDSDEVNAIYNRVAETNTVLSVSAGNNFSAGYANSWGIDANLTSNPDNAVIGSPGTYKNVLSVASVENWQIQRNYIAVAGHKMGYIDTAENYGLPSITSLTGEYEIVYIPGNGEASDFEGYDVEGKVALVQRGVISFLDKCANAEAAGAVACIIFNNTSGEFGMDLTGNSLSIPCISITFEDGAYIVSTISENPDATITFPAELTGLPSETAYEMSDFSSWGAAPDLTLEPDIAAPGGNIYSTVDGGYGVMSGTSMAAPNVSGMSALVMQYVKENFDADTDYRVLVRDLLVSTSIPLTDNNGLYYSPRKQGSGIANVFNAINTQAYITVEGSDTGKVSLGDDPEKTGEYDYTFEVHNFGDKDLFYAMDTVVQTENVLNYGIYFMAGTPAGLYAFSSENSDAMSLAHDVDNNNVTDSHDAFLIYCAAKGNAMNEDFAEVAFRYNVNGDEVVSEEDVQAYLDALVGNESEADLDDTVLRVAAGETVSVDVNIALDDYDKLVLDYYYPNGGYVEGFTFLTALNNGGIDLSLPYMGFYGDWSDAPIFDDGYYWDYFSEYYQEGMVVGNQYPHILWTEFGSQDTYPGVNVYADSEPFDMAHVSLSPNGDGYFDSINEMYISLLRNAKELNVRYSDMATGEEYYNMSVINVSKSAYSSAYGQIIPHVWGWYAPAYDFRDAEGNYLENNDVVLLEIAATGVNEGDEVEVISVPITVDLEAPELLEAKTIENLDTGRTTLELTFRDNLSVSIVAVLSSDGSMIYAMNTVEDVIPDDEGYQNYSITYDITGLTGKVMIVLSDYAVNEGYYAVNLGGEGASYGDLVAYQYNFNTGVYGWVAFDSDVYGDEVSLFSGTDDFVCAEYVNGYVFAQTESGALYGIRYEDMLNNTAVLEATYITQLDNVYQDFAYSYAEGKLYGLYTYLDNSGYPTTEINSINLKGEYYDPNMWATIAPYQEDWVLNRGGLYGLTIACDDEGSLYILGNNYDDETESYSETAHLWTVGLEYDRWSDSYMLGWSLTEVGDTGVPMDYLQSMTWDHNAEKLYWAQFDVVGYRIMSYLIEVNPETAECTAVGILSGETCALFAPLTAENAAKEEHANVPEMDSSVPGTPILRDSTLTMNVGSSVTLGYDFEPWYSEHTETVWYSDNTEVVTVDANGTVTAVGTGSATVTVANKADETKMDTITIEVTALDLAIEGVISAMDAGLGNATGTSTYKFEMVEGKSEFGTVNAITASEELNFGLSLATSELGRGSIWASEYGNTGMIYEIDPETGNVKDVLEPIDGDMVFGLSYSESMDTFTAIMNFYLYTDLELTHEESEKMLNSYDESLGMFTYHRVNMLEYLLAAGNGFVTGETGQGASSEIVFCGITGIEGGIKDSYGETYYYDTYKDYLGNWAWSGSVNYQPTQTLVLLDNVGRLWYIDEIAGMNKQSDEWGTVLYTDANGSEIMFYDGPRNGMFEVEVVDDEGNVTYNVFNIRQIVESPLTDMFRAGTMPRITYHFSDIEFAGYTAEGDPMFAMSLYDYWNNGITNELYLFIPGHMTDEMDYETWENIWTPDRLFSLGTTGDYNVIASIHSVAVTGGVDSEEAETETYEVNALGIGIYTGENESK